MEITTKVNISIDDVSPHPLSSTKCLEQCFRLIEVYPSIKFTLFISTCYQRPMAGEKSYPIIDDPKFVDEILKLPASNFEIGYHGHTHGNKKRPEFGHLDYKQSLQKLNISKEWFEKTGITVKNIFRPPAFYLSADGFQACKDFGIQLLCLNSLPKFKKTYNGLDEQYKEVHYIDCPPYENMKPQDKLDILYHACEWDGGYFSNDRRLELAGFLYNKQINFSFLGST